MKREHLISPVVFLMWLNFCLSPAVGQVTIEKEKSAVAYFQEAERYYEVRQFDRAVESFQKAIALKPDYAAAYNDLGISYAALGRHSEAVGSLREAVKIQSDFAVAHNNLGCEY